VKCSLFVVKVLIISLDLHVADILFLSDGTGNSELFHHFQEFAAIVLEEVVGDRKDASWFETEMRSERGGREVVRR
jgi:hypothetical protein